MYPGYSYDLGSATTTGLVGGAGSPTRIILPVDSYITLTRTNGDTGPVSATVDIVMSADGDPAKEFTVLAAPAVISGNTVAVDFGKNKLTRSGFYRFNVLAIGAGTTINVTAQV